MSANIATRIRPRYCPKDVEWHHICGDDDFYRREGYKLDYEYSILAYDVAAGRLDMLMSFLANGGHCERHRHVAATTTLILDGEQCIQERQEDGSYKNEKRPKGTYVISPSNAPPHMEKGGAEGCTLMLSMQTDNGILFEILDKNFATVANVTIEQFVRRWDKRNS